MLNYCISTSIPLVFKFFVQVGLKVEADGQQILVHGENSKIHCSVTAQPPPETSWYFNNNYIDTQGIRFILPCNLATCDIISADIVFLDHAIKIKKLFSIIFLNPVQ